MAEVKIIKSCKIGKIERTLFSSFIEHMGRAVYGGIYDPASNYADSNGFRNDVIELVKDLNLSLIRYPGGNFLSGYDWKDGIGAVENRPAKLDLAWAQLEPNTIGVLEFNKWIKEVGAQIMMGVNMGTGTPKDAAELTEYCNHPSETYWAELRKAHGESAPLKVEYWCLGNEMDGKWQICSMNAEKYGKKALETAKMIRWIDPNVKLTVCGSSGSTMPTYPEWDRVVLEHTYDNIDYLSLHKYYEFPDFDKSRVSDFLASFVDFDAFIRTGQATVEYVKTLKRSDKQIYLSVDEWNVWHTKEGSCDEDRWVVGPKRIENRYTALDAVVFSSLMMTLFNHADCVKIACLAQLVNVIAPILVEGDNHAIRQSIYYPFWAGSHYANGLALRTFCECAHYKAEPYGDTPNVYSAATYDEDSGDISVFLVNNGNQDESAQIRLIDFEDLQVISSERLVYDELTDVNTFENPERITWGNGGHITPQGEGNFSVTLPPISFCVVRFKEEIKGRNQK